MDDETWANEQKEHKEKTIEQRAIDLKPELLCHKFKHLKTYFINRNSF